MGAGDIKAHGQTIQKFFASFFKKEALF